VPKISFNPDGRTFDAEPNAKVLATAVRNKVAIRYGCASCRCGTCAVRLSGDGDVTPMKEAEAALLAKMGLVTDGSIRLACQTRVMAGSVSVDVSFQNEYSPDAAAEEYDQDIESESVE
jgi:ferredoxin